MGKPPSDVPLFRDLGVKFIQNGFGIVATVAGQFPVPLLVQGNIHPGVRICALNHVIADAEGSYIFPDIGLQIHILHVIPERTHIDFISNDPVHHNAVLRIPVTLCQEGYHRRQIFAAFLFRGVERIIIGVPVPGERMNHLRIILRLIIQQNRRGHDPLLRQCAEGVIVFADHPAVQLVILSVIGIGDGGIVLVRSGAQKS